MFCEPLLATKVLLLILCHIDNSRILERRHCMFKPFFLVLPLLWEKGVIVKGPLTLWQDSGREDMQTQSSLAGFVTSFRF